MYVTDGFNIRIPKGDSAIIPLTFVYENDPETPYIFAAGQYAVMSVFMDRNKDAVISKKAEKTEQDESGTVFISLSPEDTDIKRYRYSYTVKLYNADGSEVDTWKGFPERATFEIG